ncbi:AAA family ATPase [Streptomyces europaeiscabiei]|uniref:AAA family ATPase n=1 Tax=Streptomyces europaeiscabiei TaxID=146819 RepID=UPI0029B9B024|nr:MoxR family ATPase [Streptomyces europaeiscabiei]MDX3775962.1 MoxR family ATPase [Streptomyces europaeiscabiei]
MTLSYGEGSDGCTRFAADFGMLADHIGRVILGKRKEVELALTALFAEGHLLIDDYPGLGKTSLAQAMARAVEGTFHRIQFTPDILPSDIIGSQILNESRSGFTFRQGPVFANVVLCDEVNRASPKAQSALLEVMEERQVTVAGDAMAVPRPFMVVATQNPVDFAGTYPLPESQLDRFLICMRIGYPDAETERNILRQESSGRSAPALQRILLAHRLEDMIETARQVMVKDEIYDFVVRLLDRTRADEEVRLGASPRAGIALIRAARVRAASLDRHYVIPADVEALAVPVLAHRLVLDHSAEFNGVTAELVVHRAVGTVRPSR